jgi:hypothetical protein
MANFDQHNRRVENQYNAGRDNHIHNTRVDKRTYNLRNPWFIGIVALVGITITLSTIYLVPPILNPISPKVETPVPLPTKTQAPDSPTDYPFSNELEFSDSLAQNNGNQWELGPAFVFQNSKLYLNSGSALTTCYLKGTDFSDLTYEVTISDVQGQGSVGIWFRYSVFKGYRFLISTSGQYWLAGTDKEKNQGTIGKPLPTSFRLGVRVQGSYIALFLDGQQLGQRISDTNFASGEIGLLSMIQTEGDGDPYPRGNSVTAYFSNVKVWKLSNSWP